MRAFVGRHRVDADTARRGLSWLLCDATDNGARRKGPDGSHRLSYQGFTVIVSPDGAVVTGYETNHFERTPSQVRDKIPSRFGHARQRGAESAATPSALQDLAVSNPAPNTRVTIGQIAQVFDPNSAWITAAVIDHDLPDREVAVDGVRDALRRAVRVGRWVAGTAGRFNLHDGIRRWIISADGSGVLSCKPSWPSGAPPGTANNPRIHRQPSRHRRRPLPCDLCGQPGGPVCPECDRRLRGPEKKTRSGPDRLFSVRSVVSGGWPSLGKRQ